MINDEHAGSDSRNVIDRFKHQSVEQIISTLDESRSELEIAVENLTRDFNMGTIVRSANAFNVAKVHVIGRRQWNKRGAMKTDAYMNIEYHETVEHFVENMKARNKIIVAVDIIEGAHALHTVDLPKNTVMLFGSEADGLSNELIEHADKVVMIEQFGSTRSVNVGVASGIAMYAWIQQHRLS